MCLPHHDWDASFSTSNTPAITPLARRQASLPAKYTSDAYRVPPSPSLIAPTVEPIRALNATTSPIGTLPENGNSTPTSSPRAWTARPYSRWVNGRISTLSGALLRDVLILDIWINPPSALHPTVSTAACQRSRVRDPPHQR